MTANGFSCIMPCAPLCTGGGCGVGIGLGWGWGAAFGSNYIQVRSGWGGGTGAEVCLGDAARREDEGTGMG